jgi:hypothetical protein
MPKQRVVLAYKAPLNVLIRLIRLVYVFFVLTTIGPTTAFFASVIATSKSLTAARSGARDERCVLNRSALVFRGARAPPQRV